MHTRVTTSIADSGDGDTLLTGESVEHLHQRSKEEAVGRSRILSAIVVDDSLVNISRYIGIVDTLFTVQFTGVWIGNHLHIL